MHNSLLDKLFLSYEPNIIATAKAVKPLCEAQLPWHPARQSN
jgi:hypothetical protein